MPTDIADGQAPLDDYTDASATFGDRLGLAREAMGLTQAELAERIGVRPATVRNWEDDRSEPRANKLQMLAGLLNAPLVWLMSGQGDAPIRDERYDNGRSRTLARSCLAELRRLRADQIRIAESMQRLEKRLRAAVEMRP